MLCDQREQKILRFSLEKGGGRGCEATDFIRHEALLRNVKRLPDGKREVLALRVRM